MEERNWYEKDESLRFAYIAFLILRFLSPCFVQNGYLYPDEFFQSSEIMAKDILQIKSTVTWEWNATFPVRSPISTFLSSGIPFLIIHLLTKLKLVAMSPNLLLVLPRIHMTFISILSFDIPIYVICQRLSKKPFRYLFVLSTSYLTLVFATRPFSNTLETSVFGALLMLLAPTSNNSGTSKNKLGGNEIGILKCILIGCLTSLGVFCRQTFLIFALVPFLGYFIDELKRQPNYKFQIFGKLMFMALGFLKATIIFILLDSVYFGYLQQGKVVLTLWNFIKYNSLQSHMHGHHPCFTHLAINMLLLFGPITFLFYFKFGSLLLSKFYGDKQNQESNNKANVDNKNFKVILVFCAIVPVFILSFIPHQEPRFIMPVLLPLVLLFSSKVVGPKYSPTVLLSWSVWNIIGFVFFGIFHQGGVIPSLLQLHKVINDNVQKGLPMCHHVVYFHTYMPPTHLLAWPNNGFINGNKLYIHDLAGSSQEIFNQTISKIKLDYCDKNKNMLYIMHPATIKIPVENKDNLNIVKIFPHLTLEDPPHFHQLLTDLVFSDYNVDTTTLPYMNVLEKCRTYWNNFRSVLDKMRCELSLNYYSTQF